MYVCASSKVRACVQGGVGGRPGALWRVEPRPLCRRERERERETERDREGGRNRESEKERKRDGEGEIERARPPGAV